jgi:D-alanine-D-alanine ligase-like ATP-grasp enzyme
VINYDSDFLKMNILVVSDVDDDPINIELNNIEKKYIELKLAQIREYGVQVDYHEVLLPVDLVNLLSRFDSKKTVIFNWCERFNYTDGNEMEVAKIYEANNFIYTGADAATLNLLADKFTTKEKLLSEAINVPDHYFIKKDAIKDFTLPDDQMYIIKSNNLHASTGISEENIIHNDRELQIMAEKLVKELDTDLIVERFVPGDEYTVVVWGNDNPVALPVLKIFFRNKDGLQIQSNDSKFDKVSEAYGNTLIDLFDETVDPALYRDLGALAVDAYSALKINDYARVDIRASLEGLVVIDVNANPYIHILDESEVYLATGKLGYNYGETILQICEFAYKRGFKNGK